VEDAEDAGIWEDRIGGETFRVVRGSVSFSAPILFRI
jgi:hypothetical protein